MIDLLDSYKSGKKEHERTEDSYKVNGDLFYSENERSFLTKFNLNLKPDCKS